MKGSVLALNWSLTPVRFAGWSSIEVRGHLRLKSKCFRFEVSHAPREAKHRQNPVRIRKAIGLHSRTEASGIFRWAESSGSLGSKTGENSVAHAIPGLAHSSRWFGGNRVFVTSSCESDAKATFRPGLTETAMLQKTLRSSLDAVCHRQENGKSRLGEVGTSRRADREASKSTYANSSPDD